MQLLTACAGDLATASVIDNTLPISWCFLNFVVSLMVQLCVKAQISFYELVGLISASNTPLGISGVTSKWKWLFVDCSALAIFSRYFLIGHISHKIHTWAAETCGTKDTYPMRGRTEEILHRDPHQLNSAQDFWQMGICPIWIDTFGSMFNKYHLVTAWCKESHTPLCVTCPSPNYVYLYVKPGWHPTHVHAT